MFANRLRKNFRHRVRWARREGLTAYRVYDRDIPEYPFTVEWYAGRAHVVEFPRRRDRASGGSDALRAEVIEAVQAVLGVPRDRIYVKLHVPHAWGKTQYDAAGRGHEEFVIDEQGLRFWVNLGDYLDTGLFLDHRRTRARVREEAAGKRFLNLFAYTGSFTVYAAAGGARATTTVDLSKTYCAWAARNLEFNQLAGPQHEIVRADVLEWVRSSAGAERRYDLIVLDPPSFSTSKKMAGTFNVQRDHPRLLVEVAGLLAPGGTLYFSTNFQGFTLDERRLSGLSLEELTPGSIPEDFHHKGIHRCWRVRR